VSGGDVPGRIRALLGGSRYRRLLEAARERVEEAGAAARSVTLAELEPAERKALAELAGWEAIPAGPVRVDLGRLDAALRESAAGASLRDVLAAVGGPLRDRHAERRAAREGRERLWSEARAAAAGRPELVAWLEGLRASGSLARAARGSARWGPGLAAGSRGGQGEPEAGRTERDLLEVAIRVALRLPARGELLSVFASSAAGDPHALDAGTPLGALVLRAAAALAGRREVPSTSLARRQLWREVGIDCDSLSADVLVLGLRPPGEGRLARQLRESAEDGEPRRLALRELRGASLALPEGAPVFVCENPAVVEAAADALGTRSAPLVCVEGVPSTAAMVLLRGLSSAGARVCVHADLDWAGLRIAGQVLAETAGEPWRFTSADYRAGLAAGPGGPRLTGAPASSPWDASLADAMREAGLSVPEERVLADLIRDLGAWRRRAADSDT
jgi:uncharacterized protein (TIGR02679 family)